MRTQSQPRARWHEARRAVWAVVAAVLVLAASSGASADGGAELARRFERDVQAVSARVSPAYVVVSGGSGVIISPDGWVLTNHHVVARRSIGDRWWIRRPGAPALVARLVGWDPRGDIALLKAESDTPLPFAPLADSDQVQVGDMAIALGNPYGFAWDATPTVTLGVVSAVHNFQKTYSDAIQTDAPINPGNSGGPLLNLRGQVIGINGRVETRFGNRMNTGVGYAIPANQIRRFLSRLKEGGTAQHGRISGLYVRDAGPGGVGAEVTRVDSRGTGAQAGFRKGDRIVAVGERTVRSATALYGVIGTYPSGVEVEVRVRRGGEEKTLSARIEPYRSRSTSSHHRAYLGVLLDNGSDEAAPVEGARITRVEAGSPAKRAGLEVGDVVVSVERATVRSTEDLIKVIRGRRPGAKVTIDVVRGETRLSLEVTLGHWPRGR